MTASPLFQNDGYCNICMQPATFVARGPWLRDQYVCTRCNSIPRQRALAEVLALLRPHWRGLSVQESSPTLPFFAQHCPHYSYSQYWEDIPCGQDRDGARCEHLEHMIFPDGSFDIFLTQDVLEHVFDPAQSCAEVFRGLHPGGVYPFATPKHKHLARSYPRTTLMHGTVQHLCPPEYHQGAAGDKSLVTWDFGADFEDLLTQWTGNIVSNYVIRDRSRGMEGKYLDVFATARCDVNRAA